MACPENRGDVSGIAIRPGNDWSDSGFERQNQRGIVRFRVSMVDCHPLHHGQA